MLKTKDGYAKVIGTSYLGSSDYLLLSNGDSKAISSLSVNYATSAGNADTLDGVHLNGIFTAFLANSNATRLVIGGVTKDLTIPYASLSPFLCKNSTFNSTGLAGLQYYDGDMSNTTNNNSWSVPSSGWHLILHLPLSVGGYFTELSFPVNDVNGLAWRLRRSNSYYGWYRILDSNNYSSYVKKIGTSTVGSSSIPIYLNAGTPTLCSTTLGVSITGNAATATTLKTTRTLWGLSFNGTADVNGTLSGVAHILFSADNTYNIGSNSAASKYIYTYWLGAKSGLKLELGANNSSFGLGLCIDTNLNVGIGTNTPTYKLHVNGTFRATNSTVSDLFVNTGDATLKIYTGRTTDGLNDGNICFLTSIDATDGQSHTYPTLYLTRCNIVLQPRGGLVYIGTNPSTGNTTYKLYVNSKIFSNGGFVKNGSSDSYVLLGGGGHKLISDFATNNHTHSNYVTSLSTNGNYLTWTKNGSTNNITVPYATTSSYLTNGFSATWVNKWDCNAPDRIVYSDYGSDGRSIANAPSGWLYGTLLELGHTNYRGINGILNILLMWDVAHNTTLPGTLWFRGKDLVKGWAKSWAKVITDLNISSILSNYYTKSETDGKYVTLTTTLTIGGSKTFTTGIKFNVNNNGDANLGSGDGFKLFYNQTSGSNFPGNYYNVASFITGYTGFLLACYGGADLALKYRHRGDNGTWHPWKTLAFTTDIPTSLKNPHALTISLNGTSQGSYDGSAAKNINITPSSIGAATSDHNHDGRYLRLDGSDTMAGVLKVKANQYNDGYDGAIDMNNSDIYGLNSIYTVDRSDTQAEGIHFWRDSTHVDTLRMMDGNLLFTPNRPLGGSGTEQTVLHTGNSHIKGGVIMINGSSLTPLTSLPSHSHSWDSITGKPNTFTPSAHDHNYVLDIASNSHTTFAYSKPGLSKDSITWLAVWNGYEMRAMNKDQIALADHTHDDRYLKLTGGTMTGTIKFNNLIDIDSAIVLDYKYSAGGFARDIVSMKNSVYGDANLGALSILCYPDSTSNGFLYIYLGTDKYDGPNNLRIYKDKVTFGDNILIDAGNIGSLTVDKSYHLRINASGTWSTWYWLGQSGQPNWLWGTNDGGNMYVWNPSNFSVKYATSAGNADTVDGYHVSSSNNKPWGTIPVITTLGWMDIGKHLEFHHDNTTGSDYSTLLTCTGNYSNIVNLPSESGTLALTKNVLTFNNDNANYLGANFNNPDFSKKAASKYIECWDSEGGWWNWMAGKFMKAGSSDAYVLLGGGGHKPLSEFNLNSSDYDNRYLKLTGGDMTGNIRYKGSKSTYNMITFVDNNVDVYGNGICIGGGGLTIIGGGESASEVLKQHTNGGDENMIVANDAAIDFFSNMNNGWDSRKAGSFDISGYWNGAGFKKNNSNDNYVLTGGGGHTAISGLSVNYANSAGSVAWSNITDRPSSLKNPYSLNVFGVTYDGSAAKTVTTSTFVSLLSEGTSTVTDGTMFITSWASDSGFADTNAVNVPYKRKASCLWNYIDSKVSSKYLPLAGGTMNGNARIGHGSGNLYIGNSDNDGWIYTQDIASQLGTDKWWVKESGAAHFGNVYICSKNDGTYDSSIIECYTGNNLYLNYYSPRGINLCNGGGTVQIGSYTEGDTGNNKLYVNGSEFIDGASNVRNHVFADGFRHRSHNSDDAVLLAGGGYSQGVPVRYWAIYLIYIGVSINDTSYTKRSGNHDFITSYNWQSEGIVTLQINFPPGYNKTNTLIFGNGDHQISHNWVTPVYVTIITDRIFGSESQIRVLLSNDSSLDTGYANIYFMCMG